MSKPVWVGAFVVAGLVASLYGLHSCTVAREKERRDTAARAAVSELPPGVESAWLAYVDRRVAATIRRRRNTLEVTEFASAAIDRTTIISDNMPYRVDCDSIIGAEVRFGHGSEYATVPIYGRMVMDRSAEEPPPLGVSPASIAAKTLARTLCTRISQRVQQLYVAPPS